MTAVTDVQWDLLQAAGRDSLTYMRGVFAVDGVDVPDYLNLQARELVFAGLLETSGTQVNVTTDGARIMAGAR